jgi:hypothetical protein
MALSVLWAYLTNITPFYFFPGIFFRGPAAASAQFFLPRIDGATLSFFADFGVASAAKVHFD